MVVSHDELPDLYAPDRRCNEPAQRDVPVLAHRPLHKYLFYLQVRDAPWAQAILGAHASDPNARIGVAFNCKPLLKESKATYEGEGEKHYFENHGILIATVQNVQIFHEEGDLTLPGKQVNKPLGLPVCPHWSLQKWLYTQFAPQIAASALELGPHACANTVRNDLRKLIDEVDEKLPFIKTPKPIVH